MHPAGCWHWMLNSLVLTSEVFFHSQHSFLRGYGTWTWRCKRCRPLVDVPWGNQAFAMVTGGFRSVRRAGEDLCTSTRSVQRTSGEDSGATWSVFIHLFWSFHQQSLRQRWNGSSMLLAWTMPMNLNSWLHDGEVVVLAYWLAPLKTKPSSSSRRP